MALGERLPGAMPIPSPVEVRALGAFTVAVGGRTLNHADWQRVSAERLFKLLVATPGHRTTREVAAETLWPEATTDAGRASLRKALHFASRALSGSPVLVADGQCIMLDSAFLRLDVDRLTQALEAIRSFGADRSARHDDPALAAALDTILDLGALDLLPEDPYEDWLFGPRERLRSQWQQLATVAAREAQAAGRPDRAHALVDQLLERDPTDEAAHRLAIELYASEGRHHAARRQFELCRTALRASLDVEPSPETMAAHEAAGRMRGPAEDPGRRAAFVGRRLELEQVGALFDRVAEGAPARLVIQGPAGIGKSRLLEEVSSYAKSSGWHVLSAAAVEELREEAFAPIRVAISSALPAVDLGDWPEPASSAIATLVPGIGRARLTFQDRAALVKALVEVIADLARQRPLLLAIDDLPWLDESSLLFLEALIGSHGPLPVLIAVTLRDDEPVRANIDAIVDRAQRQGALTLRLEPLPRRDLDQLVLGHLGGTGLEDELGRQVFAQSGGNPLFCLELVRAASERGDVRRHDGRWRLVAKDAMGTLPDSARRIAARRLANLPGPARDLLNVASELGRDANFDVLAAASGLEGVVLLDALDAALASGLLVESGAGYRFAHPLYWLAVRSAAGLARRAATRLAIARALAGATGPTAANPGLLQSLARTSADPLPVAEHALAAAELGRRDAVVLAAAFGFAAGERLMRLHDREAAGALLRRAVDQWRRLSAAEVQALPATTAFVHLGELCAGLSPVEAEAFFRDALASSRSPEELTEAYDSYWDWLPYRRGDFDGARALLEEGLVRLPSDAVVPRAHLSGLLGWTLVRLRRADEALPVLLQAAAGVDPSSDPVGALRVLDSLGMTLHYLGRTEEGRPYVERALAIALEAGSTHGEMVGNLHVGILLTRSGQPIRARARFERTRELGRLTGNAYGESLAWWGTAEVDDALGAWESARRARVHELELLDQMGGNPHNAAMAHAHLAHLAQRCGDGVEASREAAEARRLALLSPDTQYLERIERAITVTEWADVDT